VDRPATVCTVEAIRGMRDRNISVRRTCERRILDNTGLGETQLKPTFRPSRCQFLIVMIGCLVLTFCSRHEPKNDPPAGLFVPASARRVQRSAHQGIHEVTYEVDATYPASSFLCELANYLDHHEWRGLREDALNPGMDSSLVTGWGDYDDATRQAQGHVHVWMSQWLNQQGDMLTYAIQYTYPETAKPDLTVLKVAAGLWPAGVVRSQLGSRAEQLRPSVMPGKSAPFNAAGGGQCAVPHWSDFVRAKSEDGSPALGLPYELSQVRSIVIQSDIDGLASRIAKALSSKVPTLQISTVHDPPSVPPDAVLDFHSECRCKQPGTPDGFFVREAVLYKPSILRQWREPARILFHWTDSGQPLWKQQVPAECIAQKPLSFSCRASFEQADIGFSAALASALNDAHRR
jgi:hypothetical protein